MKSKLKLSIGSLQISLY
nr:unnamed protein product [Callosobruchus analis]